LDKGYEVHGIIRRASTFNTERIDHLFNNPEIHDKKLFLHYGDLTDSSNLNRILGKVKPNEIYNIGFQLLMYMLRITIFMQMMKMKYRLLYMTKMML